MHNTEMGAYM